MLTSAFSNYQGSEIQDVYPDHFAGDIIPDQDYCYLSASYMPICFAETRICAFLMWKRLLIQRYRFDNKIRSQLIRAKSLREIQLIPISGEYLRYVFVKLTKQEYDDCSSDFKDYIATVEHCL